MAGVPEWARTGFDNIPKQEPRKEFTRDFWLPYKGSEMERTAIVTVLDGSQHDSSGNKLPSGGPYCIFQHDLYDLHKKSGEFRTCPGVQPSDAYPNCPYCVRKLPRQYVACFTVIDERTHRWVDKQGNTQERKNQKCLLRVGVKQIPAFAKEDRIRGGIAASRFEVTRTDQKSPKIGDVWTWVSKVDLRQTFEGHVFLGKDEKFEDFIKPIDYSKKLAPISHAAMLAEVNGKPAPAEDRSSEDVGGVQEDSIPF